MTQIPGGGCEADAESRAPPPHLVAIEADVQLERLRGGVHQRADIVRLEGQVHPVHGVIPRLTHKGNEDPINGCKIGAKCPIPHATEDQVYPIGFTCDCDGMSFRTRGCIALQRAKDLTGVPEVGNPQDPSKPQHCSARQKKAAAEKGRRES
jgi:hypothetical protein